MNLTVLSPGLISYGEALDIQYKLLEKRQKGEIGNTLLLLQHPPVLTLGVVGKQNNIYLSSEELKKQGIEVFEIRRGGDVTYHGPGQIVGYPIFDLRDFNKDIRLFIQKITQSNIRLLKEQFGIVAYDEAEKYTGVWVDNKKITAIGIEVKKWVTMHGFAFNVTTDLSHFSWINPCGLSKGVTSVEQLTGKTPAIPAVLSMVERYFAEEINATISHAQLHELL